MSSLVLDAERNNKLGVVDQAAAAELKTAKPPPQVRWSFESRAVFVARCAISHCSVRGACDLFRAGAGRRGASLSHGSATLSPLVPLTKLSILFNRNCSKHCWRAQRATSAPPLHDQIRCVAVLDRRMAPYSNIAIDLAIETGKL